MSSSHIDLTKEVGSIVQSAAERARDSGRPVLATVAVPSPESDPFALLSEPSSFWWSQPGLSVAGTTPVAQSLAAGSGRFIDLSVGLRKVFDSQVNAGREPLAFAGASFGHQPLEGEWASFPVAAAWVPERAIVTEGSERWLVVSSVVRASDGEAEVAEHMVASLEAPPLASAPPPVARVADKGAYSPSDTAYQGSISEALDLISRDELQKVVLARRLRLEAAVPPSPAELATALSTRYPDAFGYAIVRDHAAFIGASPELLVETDGDTVRAAPAAGTVAGTPSEVENRRLAGGLDTPKSRWEQELVTDAVYFALEPFCDRVSGHLPMVVAAGPVQHLSAEIEGILRQPVSVLELAGALHPTPAVGGVPEETALAFIREAEGFERGWYAGPVGIVRADGSGTLAVALRGALVRDGSVALFAGAGIVHGSVPEDEQREVDMKLATVMSVLSLGS